MAINWDAPIEIRDGRNGNWFWVDKIVWEDRKLSASDKVVYGTLAYFSNNRTQEAFPSYTTLEKYSGVSERQCYRSIKNLEKFKYLQIKRKSGKPNLYTLLDTPAKMSGVTSNTHTTAKYPTPPLPNKGYEQELNNKNYLTKGISSKKKLDDLREFVNSKIRNIGEVN